MAGTPSVVNNNTIILAELTPANNHVGGTAPLSLSLVKYNGQGNLGSKFGAATASAVVSYLCSFCLEGGVASASDVLSKAWSVCHSTVTLTQLTPAWSVCSHPHPLN